MTLAVLGRKPILNLRDNNYYMCEISRDLIYQVHDNNGIFVGFPTKEECTQQYIKYIVNSFKDNVVKLGNFNPEFVPACYLEPDKPALYVVSFHNNHLLVNNYDDKSAIVQWLIDNGTIVF